MNWLDNYEKWQQQAEQEFRNSEFWHEEYDNFFVINENGDVYLGGLRWIKKAVTPWKESEFYTE